MALTGGIKTEDQLPPPLHLLNHKHTGLLRHTANSLGETVFGKKMVPSYTAPHKFTGELLGVEYLYSQTGKVLQDIDHDDAEEEVEKKQEEEVEEEEEDDEGFGDVEDFIDFTIPPLEVPPPSSTEQHPPPLVKVQRQPKPFLHIPTVEEYRQAMSENVAV